MYTEDCPFCVKEHLKREHASLYEANGWLHICKTRPANRSVNYVSGEQLASNYDFDTEVYYASDYDTL